MTQRPNMRAPAERAASPGPPVDIAREADHLVVTVSLPGVRPGDFRISLVGDRQMYIEGNVHYRHAVPREALALCERPYGPFNRTVPLPLPVQTEGAGIRFEHGVLTARLPLRLVRLPLHWQGAGGSTP